MTFDENNDAKFKLTFATLKLLDSFRTPGSAKRDSLLRADRDESHVDDTVAFINQSLDAEAEFEQKLIAFPTIEILEDEEAITELKALVDAHLRTRLFQRNEIPLYQHLDEILDAIAGPVILTTDALRRFFHVAVVKLIPMLFELAKQEQARRFHQREEGNLAVQVPEAIDQISVVFRRFRAKNICLKDFLESSRAAEIFLYCLEHRIECKDDARIMLQLNLIAGCTADELAEYFGIGDVSIVKQILRKARKSLWLKAIEVAKKEPGFNSSYTI